MNIIANSGIQYYTVSLEVNLNDNYKVYFHEWFDDIENKIKLEIAHKFTEGDVWVKKQDLFQLGYIQHKDEEIDGKLIAKGSINEGWEEVKKDFIEFKKEEIPAEDCFTINHKKCGWEDFENVWLPIPFFSIAKDGSSNFGPINWCRGKLILSSVEANIRKYNLVLAFDTRTSYEDDEGFEDDHLMENPVFLSIDEKEKNFGLCNNEFSLVDFCSKAKNCGWVDKRILKIIHDVENFDDLKTKGKKLEYLARYIFLLNFIQHKNVVSDLTLFSDKNEEYGDVDLVVDIGNSRTRAVLFDNSDFTRVDPLELQNFTTPVKNNILNRNSDSFEMRLAFREAEFGGEFIYNSHQFTYPSMIRLGEEANELIHKATNLNTGIEKVTTFSSPKRYLWDNKPQKKEWEFVTLKGEETKSIYIDGVSEFLNADGSLNNEGEGGIVTFYSRKALMTLCFLEILSQAKMQINSYKFRHKWGSEKTPRKVGRMIITCPTAMSKVEQVALRQCAEDASVILDKFYEKTSNKKQESYTTKTKAKVIPSVENLSNIENTNEWIYDEATCSQFLYLYTEIKERYRNNTKEYFDFYGKIRNDLDGYNKKSVTIGSVDIGAGTTDVMIAAYKNKDENHSKLTPVPLFWESFYIAGDDLLKTLIDQYVIQGQYSAIQNHLKALGKTNIIELILDFFGRDNARLSVQDRQIRSEFNLQVSIPVISYFLELLNKNKVDNATLEYDDIFSENEPTERVQKHFLNHFGFSIKDIKWSYDKSVISKIVQRTFEPLISKLSTVLSYYGCDIVLLTGRPTSLKPLSDLFLRYFAISPNRLIRLNSYRVGTWYPFQDGKGYFEDAKSIVAVGAMIGNQSSIGANLNGFALDFTELNEKLKPTTEYFTKAIKEEAFISPEINNASITVSNFPIRLYCRQLNSVDYPTRPFYKLDFNLDKVEEWVKNRPNIDPNDRQQVKEATDEKIKDLLKSAPYTFDISREDYPIDMESLIIESVQNNDGEDASTSYFSLQIQSMSESEDYWMDTGHFDNLNINDN